MKGQLGKKLAVIQKKTANKCAKFRIFFVQQAERKKFNLIYVLRMCAPRALCRGTMGTF